ncbi:hypothetical protein BD779DRAFT_1477072 [Infundibulicybe gibba]|nr:hypothetical protein BD779DRAFT_1477072 [Infundibulicybe gibba]
MVEPRPNLVIRTGLPRVISHDPYPYPWETRTRPTGRINPDFMHKTGPNSANRTREKPVGKPLPAVRVRVFCGFAKSVPAGNPYPHPWENPYGLHYPCGSLAELGHCTTGNQPLKRLAFTAFREQWPATEAGEDTCGASMGDIKLNTRSTR